MLRARDFLVRAVHVVAFSERTGFEASQVLTAVFAAYASRFSGQVEVVPLPDEVPSEVPRVELTSKDSAWKITAAPGRTGVAWNSRDDAGIPQEELEDIVVDASGVLQKCVSGEPRLRVNRLGFIVIRVLEAANPAKMLIEQFCRGERHNTESNQAPLRNSQSFQLHNLKTYPSKLDQHPINSWVRCKSAIIDGSNVIVVEQDLNTVANLPDRQIDETQLESFFTQSIAESKAILNLYFPDVG